MTAYSANIGRDRCYQNCHRRWNEEKLLNTSIHGLGVGFPGLGLALRLGNSEKKIETQNSSTKKFLREKYSS